MTDDRLDSMSLDAGVETGRFSLRFPPALERRFEAETGLARSRSLVWRGLVAIGFFVVYLAADWMLTPDVFGLALVLRLAIVLPLALVAVARLWFNPRPALRESLVGGVCVAAGVSTLLIMLLSVSPLRDAQQDAVILVVLFVVIVERLRFPYAVASTVLMTAAFVTAVLVLPGADKSRQFSEIIVFGGAAVLSLVAGYTLERETRRSYLLGLRERLRSSNFKLQSLHDPLTGLENRRALDDALAQLSGPDGRQMAIIVADIDHFKSYNDTLGHVAGDQCLKRIAGAISAELRSNDDRAVRFGGEEFLVLLPDTELPVALAIAERMRRAVEEVGIPHPGRILQGSITASFGVGVALVGGSVTVEELIESADAALYAAKAAGRNQVWPQPSRVARMPDRAIDRIRRAESA